MSKTYTITSEQVSQIHNAGCYLHYALDQASELFKNDSRLVENLNTAMKYLDSVRKDVVARKDADHDRIFKMARALAEKHNFKYTIWSIYEIESFDDKCNLPQGAIITSEYSDDQVILRGTTWLDAWMAVEDLAGKTQWNDVYKGFGDHRFIEKFHKVKDKENTYEVWMGS